MHKFKVKYSNGQSASSHCCQKCYSYSLNETKYKESVLEATNPNCKWTFSLKPLKRTLLLRGAVKWVSCEGSLWAQLCPGGRVTLRRRWAALWWRRNDPEKMLQNSRPEPMWACVWVRLRVRECVCAAVSASAVGSVWRTSLLLSVRAARDAAVAELRREAPSALSQTHTLIYHPAILVTACAALSSERTSVVRSNSRSNTSLHAASQ